MSCYAIRSGAAPRGYPFPLPVSFFSGNAGDRVTQILSVTNPSTRPVSFRLFLRDFYRDSVGEKQYSPPGSSPGSNAGWVEGLPGIIDLAAGEKRDIPIHLDIPADSVRSQKTVSRCMLFVSQIARPDTSAAQRRNRSLGIQIRLEAAVHIYYTPGHCINRSVDFVAFDDRGDLNRGKDTVRRYAVRIRNDGDVFTDATLRLELTDKDNGEETKIPEKRLALLPGTEQTVYMDLPVLKGRWLAVAYLDTGDQNDLKVAQKDILY